MPDLFSQDAQSLIILGAISICVFGAVFLIIASMKPRKVLDGAEYDPLPHRGTLTRVRADLKERSVLYRITLPIIGYIAFFVSKLPINKFRARVNRKLTSAGNPGTYTADEFLGIAILFSVGVPLMLVVLFEMIFGVFHPLVVFSGFLFGLVYPHIWLTDSLTRRTKSINRGLPYTLDLLTLSIEAGLDFIAAVERIVTKKRTRGPLSEELFQMLQELKMGKTRREALRDMANRVNLDNLNTVVSALIQADQLGTSLGPVLRIQSEMLRLRRSQRAEKLAMEAPVKMIFPLLFIFTSVFLLLFGPVIIKAMRGSLL